jgi:cell wall-associated NlpC family hydrolase
LRIRTLLALGLLTVTATWAPAASAAVSGGASVTSEATTRAPDGKKARRAKKKSPAKKAPQAQQVQESPPQQEPPEAAAGGAGVGYVPPPESRPTVPGDRAVFRDGIAYAPAAAPLEVQQAVWAANDLLDKPYVYGGGHKSFRASGYDCSGTVSYALNGAGVLDSPLDSSTFMSWGEARRGTWITVYTNPGHAFVVIAGLRLDTSGPGQEGPRWRPGRYSTRGYKARHPENF